MIEDRDIETDESILRDLEAIEERLAQQEKLNIINGSIRDQLITRYKNHELVENELVSQWLDLYTTHMYWSKRNE